MTLIALHIIGALYHTLLLRDGLLKRMFFGRRTVAKADFAQAPAKSTSEARP
jgi:cytochrome b561